jgi:hypothetical protein
VAESTDKGIRLINLPQHIYRYLMDNKKETAMPATITYLNNNGTTTTVTEPQQHLKMLRAAQLYKPCPTEPEALTKNKEDENTDEEDNNLYRIPTTAETDTINNQDDQWTTIPNQYHTYSENTQDTYRTDRYHTGASPSGADRYAHHHHEIAFGEAKDYYNENKSKEDIYTRGLSQEVGTDIQRRTRDLLQRPNELYSSCDQCSRNPRHRLRLEAHKSARVRILITRKGYYFEKPIEIYSYEIPTVSNEANNAIKSQDWAIYGRDAYWQDHIFYQNMIINAEKNIRHTFPLKTFIDLGVNIELEPTSVTYTTPFDTIYVIDTTRIISRLCDAPEPQHIIEDDSIITDRTSVDAEFFITFILKDDIRPAKQLQLLAREDELVQRLKAIQLDESSSSSFTNLGKVMLACAAFQDRKWDTDFQKQWRPNDKITPIEELLDLRTQLDLKRKEYKDTKSDFRVKSSSYQLRKGMQQRQQRIQQRAYNQYQQPHQRNHYATNINANYPNTTWRNNSSNYYPTPKPRSCRQQENMRNPYRTYKDVLQGCPKVEPLKLTKYYTNSQKNIDQKQTEDSWQISSNSNVKNPTSTTNQNKPKITIKLKDQTKTKEKPKQKPNPTPQPNSPDSNQTKSRDPRKDVKRRKPNQSEE